MDYFGLLVPLLVVFDLRGVGFVLPGLFIVIFIEMLLNAKNKKIRIFGISGMVLALVMLILFGKQAFMLISMISMLAMCYVAYKWGGVRID